MNVYGIGYRVTTTPAKSFDITSTYVASTSESTGWIRLPQTWRFAYPTPDGVPAKLGASETLGILGGIENQRQHLYSEMLERAIGDVLTTVVCEILDATGTSEECSILVFGLAFPKLVGRILSLRPPPNIRLSWICPTPFPAWIAEGISESALLGSLSSGFGTDWDDEAIVRTSSIRLPGWEASVYIQELGLWESRATFDGKQYNWLTNGLCDALLPREIVVAAGHVHNHIDSPYTGEPEESLRPLSHPQFPAEAYSVLPRQRRGGLPVWDITWLPTGEVGE